MKYIFVGDIHGKVDKVKEALGRDGKKIFVGDIIDSYDHTIMEHDECYRLIIDAIEKDEAECLLGNHELSYRMQHHRCSGWDHHRASVMRKYSQYITDFFKPFLMIEGMLITHAGLTKQLWDEFNLTEESVARELTKWWPDDKSPMHYVGRARGGIAPYGGIFWCDFNMEFIPVPGLTQIFGHTRGHGIRQVEQSYCIDCLDFSDNNFLELELE